MSASTNAAKNTNQTTTNTQASETNLAATGTQGVTLLGNSGPTTLASNTSTTTSNTTANTSGSFNTSDVGNTSIKTTETNSGNYTYTPSIGNTSNSNNTYVDEGAVSAGTALGHYAIASNTGLTESLASDYEHELENSSTQSASLVSDALDKGFAFLSNENDTIANIEQQNATNLSTAYGNYARTLGQVSTQTNTALGAAYGQYAGTLGAISTAQDTSLASQSTQFATSSLKIAAVVVLGVALIYFASKHA